MSLKSAPFYWWECDICGVSAQEGSDYSAWKDADTADIEPEASGWHIEDGNALCGECLPLTRDDYDNGGSFLAEVSW